MSPTVDEYTARQVVQDADMRRALWVWLRQSSRHPGDLAAPSPPNDDQVTRDLRRILMPRSPGRMARLMDWIGF